MSPGPHPLIPHTTHQARMRDQFAERRGEHDPDHNLIAALESLRLVDTGHGIALQRHDQHFPLTQDELAWLRDQTPPAAA